MNRRGDVWVCRREVVKLSLQQSQAGRRPKFAAAHKVAANGFSGQNFFESCKQKIQGLRLFILRVAMSTLSSQKAVRHTYICITAW